VAKLLIDECLHTLLELAHAAGVSVYARHSRPSPGYIGEEQGEF